MENKLVGEYNLRVVNPIQVFELPENAHFNGLEELGINEEEGRQFAEEIAEFRNLPILIDQFDKDHTARRIWRQSIEAEYGEDALNFLKKNKLRVNSFTFINFLFNTIDFYARKVSGAAPLLEKVHAIREKYRATVRGYGDMNLDEKIAAVHKLDEVLEEILQLLQI